MMDQAQTVAKRKHGVPRDPSNTRVNTAEVRRHRDRAKLQEMAEQVAVASASAAAKSLTPPDVSDEIRELIDTSAQEINRILATEGAAVIQSIVNRAKEGDINAASLLAKYLISPKTKIKLPMQQGDSIESFADNIIASATRGELALDDADAALRLLQRHSEVSLNAGLTARLSRLNEQLAEARENNVIDSEVTLSRTPIPLEDFLAMQRGKA
jgi:hypothetical protein